MRYCAASSYTPFLKNRVWAEASDEAPSFGFGEGFRFLRGGLSVCFGCVAVLELGVVYKRCRRVEICGGVKGNCPCRKTLSPRKIPLYPYNIRTPLFPSKPLSNHLPPYLETISFNQPLQKPCDNTSPALSFKDQLPQPLRQQIKEREIRKKRAKSGGEEQDRIGNR